MKRSRKTWNENFLKSLRTPSESESESEYETDSDEESEYDSEDESGDRSGVRSGDRSGDKLEDQYIGPLQKKINENLQIDQPHIFKPVVSSVDKTVNQDFGLSLPTETEEWILSEDLAFLDQLVRETYPERIKALQFLKNMLKSNNASTYFDEEDRKWVDEDLDKQIEELKKLNQIWKQTTYVYRNTLLKLAATIHTRQRVLSYVDDKTNVFSQRPKLVELFAQKQADLTALMELCKEKIRQEQQEVRDRLLKENAEHLAVLHELDETVIPSEIVSDEDRNITTTVAKVKKLVNDQPTTKRTSQSHSKSKSKSKQKHKKSKKKVSNKNG